MKILIKRLLFFLLIMAQPVLCAEDKNQHPLQGRWLGQTIIESGKKMKVDEVKAHQVFFHKDTIKITKGNIKIEGRFNLNDTKQPKWIDLKLTIDGSVSNIQAIYEVRDGILRFCHFDGSNHKRRPEVFKDVKGYVLATFKKNIEQVVAPDA